MHYKIIDLKKQTRLIVNSICIQKNFCFQDKSREILQNFRGKDADDLISMFRHEKRQNNNSFQKKKNLEENSKENQSSEDDNSTNNLIQLKPNVVDDLCKTLDRVNKRNSEWSKMIEFGHNPNKNIFEIKFPPFFIN